jgi:ADP-heptose:LPS heptosyltransferase
MSIGFPNRIAIARTDSIGDVLVTLPLCGYIKKHAPNTHVIFIGRSYTKAIAEACPFIDEFVNYDFKDDEQLEADAVVFAFPDPQVMQWVKSKGIPIRIATARRKHSWIYANKRIWFSRKKSDLHESQLNFHLLKPFGVVNIPSLEEITNLQKLAPQVQNPIPLVPNKRSVIFHMLSKGSAKNWSFEQFSLLSQVLEQNNCHVYLTGTEQEGSVIQSSFTPNQNITDLTGKLSLAELIAFIASCDCLVAASTGPLHIAGACGIHAIGLYPNTRPMHPGRWAPIGKHVYTLEDELNSTSTLQIEFHVVYRKISEALKLDLPSA